MIVLGILLAIESYRIQEKTPAQIKLKNKKLVTVIATGTMWIFFMTLLFTMYALTGTNHHTQEHLELYGNTAHDHHD